MKSARAVQMSTAMTFSLCQALASFKSPRQPSLACLTTTHSLLLWCRQQCLHALCPRALQLSFAACCQSSCLAQKPCCNPSQSPSVINSYLISAEYVVLHY